MEMVMDTLFMFDNKICLILRRLGVKSAALSEKQSIQRFFQRDCCKLKPASYTIKGQVVTSDKVWMFWAQGVDEMPLIVRKCYDSVLENANGLDVILLDLKSCHQYVDIPSYIYDKVETKEITLTHFSDILRFNLLKKWGGYWIDATVLVTQPLEMGRELFTIKHPYNSDYISGAKWCGFLWRMPKGFPLACFMVDYLNSYWKRYDHLLEYFLIDHVIEMFYKKNLPFKNVIDELTVSNKQLYFFQSDSCESSFDSDGWNRLKQNNQFFKATWKSKRKEMTADGHQTYYGQIFA